MTTLDVPETLYPQFNNSSLKSSFSDIATLMSKSFLGSLDFEIFDEHV